MPHTPTRTSVPLKGIPTLYMWYSPYCQACEAAMPEVDRWRAKHSELEFGLVKLNASLREWSIAGFMPQATPAYAIVWGQELIKSFTGKMSLAQLDKFTKLPKVNSHD